MVPMSLNIKNERTHALVRELATLRGVSQTDAVTEAVQHRLDELRRSEDDAAARYDEVMRLAREIRENLGDADLSTDELYDEEWGLPK